jgi:hypothetical protein
MNRKLRETFKKLAFNVPGQACLFVGLAAVTLNFLPASTAQPQNASRKSKLDNRHLSKPLPTNTAPNSHLKKSDTPTKPVTLVDSLYLFQTSSLFGDRNVYICANAIKISDPRSALSLCAKSPNWDINLLQSKSKRIYTVPLSAYHGASKKLTAITGGISLLHIPFKKIGKNDVNGINAMEYQNTKEFAEKQAKAGANESADPRFVHKAQMLVSPEKNIPPQAVKILNLFMGVPNLPARESRAGTINVPLKFCYLNLRGDVNDVLITSEKKKLKMPETTFLVPTDYLKIKSEQELEPVTKPKRR